MLGLSSSGDVVFDMSFLVIIPFFLFVLLGNGLWTLVDCFFLALFGLSIAPMRFMVQAQRLRIY